MKEKMVHVSSLHQRNDTYSGFEKKARISLPNTEDLQNHILAIPCGWWLSVQDINVILVALKKSVAQVV